MFDIDLYNDEFFLWHLTYAREYSMKTMDWYIDAYKPTSVVDFGCGIGSYLESCYNKGIKNIAGYDIGGEYAQKYTPDFLYPFIEYCDCTKPIKTQQKYECVISFETIEHIEPSGTNVFIENLVNATDFDKGRILFTGAPPEQEGCGHINCRDKQEWIEIFAEQDFTVDQHLTELVKDAWTGLNVGCPPYIINNLLIFKH
jgi:cyclopropane fatty-acyl-phospholipid synthase-like methyltransferase